MCSKSGNATCKRDVVVLYCQHCVSEEVRITAAMEQVAGFSIRAVMVPCSSKVQVSHLLKVIEEGADGIELVGCPDDECQHLVGSRRAEKRVEYARSLLGGIGVGADRIGLTREKGLSTEGLMDLADQRAKAIESLGPHPMKSGPAR